MILDHYLIVKEWYSNFDPATDSTEKMLVWIRFPALPIEYYNSEFLMKIGGAIDRPVKIDQATNFVNRGMFARMCVEIDITKPLVSKFKLRRRVRKIEYEGMHLVCFKCGIYGHVKESCKTLDVGGVFEPGLQQEHGGDNIGMDDKMGNAEAVNERVERAERVSGLDINPEILEHSVLGCW